MSLPFENILLAVDSPHHAVQLLETALQLQSDPEEIHIIHSCEHPITGYGEVTGQNHVVTETQIKQHAYRGISEVCRRYAIPLVNLHITSGNTATAIHEAAKELGTDLIIVGTHGEKGIHLFGRSLTDEIIHLAPCPVLTQKIED